ncbi:MAG: rhomboid family intramembrane serine protease, partial [Phycisphaerae bacterium]|nr:rhomboid family intramembrane serine protease [Phycisphaerae bacterium]
MPRSGGRFGQNPNARKPISATTWLILICFAVYMLDPFFNYFLKDWLHLSTTHSILGVQYWRFIGFQFLHANFQHLLFNMIGLYFFGPLVEQYLGGKRFLAFYLLCGIFGAVLYLLLNLGGLIFGDSIPGFLFNDPSTP